MADQPSRWEQYGDLSQRKRDEFMCNDLDRTDRKLSWMLGVATSAVLVMFTALITQALAR